MNIFSCMLLLEKFESLLEMSRDGTPREHDTRIFLTNCMPRKKGHLQIALIAALVSSFGFLSLVRMRRAKLSPSSSSPPASSPPYDRNVLPRSVALTRRYAPSWPNGEGIGLRNREWGFESPRGYSHYFPSYIRSFAAFKGGKTIFHEKYLIRSLHSAHLMGLSMRTVYYCSCADSDSTMLSRVFYIRNAPSHG